MASVAGRLAVGALLAAGVLACRPAEGVTLLEGILVMVSYNEVCRPEDGVSGEFPDLGPLDPCSRTIIIESSGLVREAGGSNLGVLSMEALNALKAAIGTTDFEVLRQAPWQGMCADEASLPSLITYDVFIATDRQRVAACGTDIDRDHPLFVALADALNVVGQPLP